MKVVLQDIVRRVAKATKLAQPEARAIVLNILATLEKGLFEGQHIEIRDFGSFRTKTVAGKKGRDLSRNLSIPLPAYRKVSFKPGKNLKKTFWNLPRIQEPVATTAGQLEMFREAV